jgi:hypothetical protein
MEPALWALGRGHMDDKKNELKRGSREYFRNLRAQLLVKLGLPENTRPERVGQMLELKAELEKLGNKDKPGPKEEG